MLCKRKELSENKCDRWLEIKILKQLEGREGRRGGGLSQHVGQRD